MEIKLDLNHTYLIRFEEQIDTIHSIIVLHITNKAYHLRWNGDNDTWELKKRFDSLYSIEEDISDLILDINHFCEIVSGEKVDLCGLVLYFSKIIVGFERINNIPGSEDLIKKFRELLDYGPLGIENQYEITG